MEVVLEGEDQSAQEIVEDDGAEDALPQVETPTGGSVGKKLGRASALVTGCCDRECDLLSYRSTIEMNKTTVGAEDAL